MPAVYILNSSDDTEMPTLAAKNKMILSHKNYPVQIQTSF